MKVNQKSANSPRIDIRTDHSKGQFSNHWRSFPFDTRNTYHRIKMRGVFFHHSILRPFSSEAHASAEWLHLRQRKVFGFSENF